MLLTTNKQAYDFPFNIFSHEFYLLLLLLLPHNEQRFHSIYLPHKERKKIDRNLVSRLLNDCSREEEEEEEEEEKDRLSSGFNR